MSTPEPSPDDLADALARLHGHGLLADVATLADALASPTASALVRMHARLHARGVVPFAPTRYRPQVIAPEPPHPAEQLPQAPRRTRSKPRKATPQRQLPIRPADPYSSKRAASGDRDDD